MTWSIALSCPVTSTTGSSGRKRSRLLRELDTVHAGHHDVGDHEVEVVGRAQDLERMRGPLAAPDIHAARAEDHFERVAMDGFVVDHQDARHLRHKISGQACEAPGMNE